MIVCFTLGMMQLNFQATHFEAQFIAIGQIRFWRRRGKKSTARRNVVTSPTKLSELAFVDDLIVTVGQVVTIESFWHVFVSDDTQCRVPGTLCISDKSACTAHMIRMPMGIDDSIESPGSPATHRVNDFFATLFIGRIKSDQTVVRIKQHTM